MFFVFGFVTWTNAMLIPYFKIACELSNLQAYLVTFAFYISYLVMSVPASYILERIGFRKGMMTGFWVMAVGAFIFIPAALHRSYPIFLIGLFTIGIGLAMLQTAANPYVTILGDKDRAAQRISIMGICNKTAGIIAPLLLAAIILKSGDQEIFRKIDLLNLVEKKQILDNLIRRVIFPYAFVCIVLTILGFVVRYSSLPEIDHFRDEKEEEIDKSSKTIFDYPYLILGGVAIFLHVGAQILAVDSIIGYAQSMGLTLIEAKAFPSYTLLATIVGYLLGISLIPSFISQMNALRICTVLGILFSIGVLTVNGTTLYSGHPIRISIWFLVFLGFANSMIWAGIWPLALTGLGKHLKLGASILIMGLSGNAIIPLIYGYIADRFNLKSGYWVLLPCYTFLLFYAFYGYRIKRWSI